MAYLTRNITIGLARSGRLLWAAVAALFVLTLLHEISTGSIQVSRSTDSHGRPSLQRHVQLADGIWAKTVRQRHEMEKAWGADAPEMPYFAYRYATERAQQKRLPFSIWEFIPPSYSCPYEVERIGRMGDGGKWVCGMSVYENLPPQRRCVVYSFGVNHESSFEEEILSRTNCEVWAYDPSVDDFGPEITANHRSRANFTKAGIGAETNVEKKPPFYTLSDLMEMNGHDYIDIMKIDVERAEYDSLSRFASDVASHEKDYPIGQLLIEIHLYKDNEFGSRKFLKWWETMEDHGMRATWSEMNLFTATIGETPEYSEFTLINRRSRKNALFRPLYDS